MRPKQQEWTGEPDFFRARLDQIINMKHALVRLASTIDWAFIDERLSECFSEQGRPAVPTRFMVGLLLLKQIHGLPDELVCDRWVYDPYFQFFTGAEFFAHEFPHERSGISHWRKRIGGKLDALLAETGRSCNRRVEAKGHGPRHRRQHGSAQSRDPSHRCQADA